MTLSVIFVSVLLWTILVPAETKFYLEILFPNYDITKLIENMDTGGVDPTLVLYECEGKRSTVKCDRIDGLFIKSSIHGDTNFNGVTDLGVPRGHTVKIEGEKLDTNMIEAMAIGVEHSDSYLKKHMPALGDMKKVNSNINKYLGRLIGLDDASDTQTLLHYFSINHNGYFFHADTPTQELFESYVTILQKVINASGYSNNLGSPLRPRPPPKPKTETQPKPVRSKSQSSCGKGNLCHALFGSKFSSRSQSTEPKKTWSQRFRSWSKSSKSTKSSTKVQPLPESQSPPKKFPKSSSRDFSGSPTKPKVDSPSRSPSRPPSLPRSLSLSNSYLLQAAGFLSFKMFDPCFLIEEKFLELDDAEYYCTMQCQFLSATMKLYNQVYAEECKFLKTGSCKSKRCVCTPRRGEKTGNINMAFCNNHLRLQILSQNP